MSTHAKRSVIILGCTGSIGTTALKALEAYRDHFTIVGLSAHNHVQELARIAASWGCRDICITSENDPDTVRSLFPDSHCFLGKEQLLHMIRSLDADIVLNAISGAEGLAPSFAAIESGKDLALSNKESVVMAGNLLFDLAGMHAVKILPVDSEHSTLHALLAAHGKDAVSSLILTASGGPFREFPIERIRDITPEMAVAHPTWSMGAKISIDSATLANKGLEVMEASFLFTVPSSSIEVVVHPQSVVHSLVRLHNGALYAQMSPPDMALPIMSALADGTVFLQNVVKPLDFTSLNLTFMPPDLERFPLLGHAFICAQYRNAYPIAYNAANEVAVASFVSGKIRFDQIASVVAHTLESDWHRNFASLFEILDLDKQARAESQREVERLAL